MRYVDATTHNVGAQRPVASALEVDDVDQRGVRGDDAAHELFDGLAEEDPVVVALFKAYGVIAEQVEGGDDLHSSVLAR